MATHEQPFDLRPFRLFVPVPPMLAEACGYAGQILGQALDARYVAFYWEQAGDEIMYDDEKNSGTGEYSGYLAFVDHPSVAAHLREFDFGSSETRPRHYLLLDRTEHTLYALPVKLAQQFLHGQWQEVQASETSSVLHIDSLDELTAALDLKTWQEVTLGEDISTQVMAAMQRQGQLVNDMMQWLNNQQTPLSPERIAEYQSRMPAMLLRFIVDQSSFVRAGELVHLHEVITNSDSQITCTFYRDNGVDGPDTSSLFSVTGSWATVASYLEPLIELGTLDDLLSQGAPLESLCGRYAAWNGQAFPIVQMRDSLAIRVSLPCARCGKNLTMAFARSGLHRGAFCYVYDYRGKFQANLRDQEYVCPRCEGWEGLRGDLS